MILGLTGSIGCGKSVASKFFEETGAKIISSDSIGHRLLSEDPNIFSLITTRWGKNVIGTDGLLDRKKIAEIVFHNNDELGWLEDILHHRINSERNTLISQDKNAFWVVEIPLLFEKKLENACDSVVCIYTSPNVQFERLYAKGYTSSKIEARLRRQLPLQVKLEKSHYIISNDGSLDFLKQQIFYLVSIIYGRNKSVP